MNKRRLVETFDRLAVAVTNGDLQAFTSRCVEAPLHLPPRAPMKATRGDIRTSGDAAYEHL